MPQADRPAGRVGATLTSQPSAVRVEKIVDGDNNTGWGASATDGTGEAITFDFGKPIVLTQIGLTPGFLKYGPRVSAGCQPAEAFSENRFVASVRFTFDDGTELVHDFTETPTLQVAAIPEVTTTRVSITILRTVRPPGADDDTILSEATFMGRP